MQQKSLLPMVFSVLFFRLSFRSGGLRSHAPNGLPAAREGGQGDEDIPTVARGVVKRDEALVTTGIVPSQKTPPTPPRPHLSPEAPPAAAAGHRLNPNHSE